MTAAGKLPAVAQRIGQDPLVIKPVHSIGKYGGEIRRGYITAGDFNNGTFFCTGPDSLLYIDYAEKNIVPNLARGFELSKDNKELTLHLRRGMKWSDGQPFTADDIVFWYESMYLNHAITAESSVLAKTTVKKIDDVTVQYISTEPYPQLPRVLAAETDLGGPTAGGKTGQGGFAPKHYLSKFHPDFTSEKEANRIAGAAGFANWSLYLLNRNDFSLNPDLPSVSPWVVTRPINNSPWTFEANPYSIWVDTEGNQLPYIPKITMQDAGNKEVIALRAVAGEYDFQDRNLQVASLPVLLKNQKRSNYTVHRAPMRIQDFLLRLNLAYDKDKVIGDLVRNVDFRRALSLGIDRNQINQTFFLGTAVATSAMVADDSPYFAGPEWRTKWATLDVAQANQLLDKIGLTKKDATGLRMRPDGKGPIRLDYIANTSVADFPAMGEIIRTQWKRIGIDLNVETLAPSLFIQKTLSGDFNMQGITAGNGNEDVFIDQTGIVPTTMVTGPMGIPYAKWYLSGGKDGVKPPNSMKLLINAMDMVGRGSAASDSERIQIGKQIYMMHVDQVWSIGVVGFGLTIYGLYLANNKLGNVPKRIINSGLYRNPTIALPMTFYYT